MRYPWCILVLSVCVSFCAHALAVTSLGGEVLGGNGTSGFGIAGSVDLGPEKNWETSVSYAHQKTTAGTESRTNQYTLDIAHSPDPSWDVHGGVSSWNDSINAIRYLGPTVGVTYSWKASPQVEQKIVLEPLEHRPEILSVSVNAEVFVYTTEVVTSPRTVRSKGRTVTVPSQTTKEQVTQFHPSLEIARPLWEGVVMPFLSGGVYAYSRDPAVLENIAGQPRFSASAGRIHALVGGFLKKSWMGGVRLGLPLDLQASANVGREQLATDKSWSTSYEVTLWRNFWNHMKVKLDWSRADQAGTKTNVYTGGLTYLF